MSSVVAFDPNRDRLGRFWTMRRPPADMADVELFERRAESSSDPLVRNRLSADDFAFRYAGRGMDMDAPGRFDGMTVSARCDWSRTGSPAAPVFAIDPATGDHIVLDDGLVSYDDIERIASVRRGGTLAELQADIAALAARRTSG